MTDEMEMARRQAACDEVAQRIRSVYAGKASAKEFATKRVSGSSLVSKTAEQIAQELLDAHTLIENGGRIPMTGSYWSFWGDMASTRIFEGEEVNVDGTEFWVTYDIGDGWVVSCHPDGAKIVDNKYVVVLEQKNYARPADGKKKIIILRQAALYLAMMRAQVKKTGGFLFAEDPNYVRPCKPFPWTGELIAAGVVRSVCCPRPPGEATGVAFSDEDLDAHLEHMVQKALHIKEAVEKRDIDIARLWDSEHPDEFGGGVDAPSNEDEVRALAAEYVELQEAEKNIAARKEAIKIQLRMAAEANGNEWSNAGYVVKIENATTPGKWNKALAEEMGVLEKLFTPGKPSSRLLVSGPEDAA